MSMNLEIMDTTLRDGEQMKNVGYSPDEKLALIYQCLLIIELPFLQEARLMYWYNVLLPGR